jgi:hypothetical protein
MSDSKDPQDLNPEEQNNPEQEIKDLKLLRIAISYLSREIADDTPSEINGLTALDQLIAYEFGIEDDEKFNERLEELKDDVIFVAQCLEEEDEVDVEMYVSDKEQVIRRIAIYTLAELITDDVVSRWPEYTPLEQIIMYEWGYIEDKEITKIKKRIKDQQLMLRGGSALKSKKEYNEYIPESRF